MAKDKLKVAVVGASGYAGCELIRILLRHPDVCISSVSRRLEGSEKISDIFPVFRGQLDLACENVDVTSICGVSDFIFLALPHKVSMAFVPAFLEAGKKVVDLSADYRLKDTAVYEKWYGIKHTSPELLDRAVYGLPEVNKKKICAAKLVANPGCYPTGCLLGIIPLLSGKFIDAGGIIIDAKSGATGAGRTPAVNLLFSEVNENLKAYKVNRHQHMPEINQELSGICGSGIEVVCTPHLVPMNKGILSTIYMTLDKDMDTSSVLEVFKGYYKAAPFVRVLSENIFPETKDVLGTNFCDIGVKTAGRRVIVVTAIDNLYKGASSQAVHNMNLMQGFDEKAGLA